jgi:hypothetical protein
VFDLNKYRQEQFSNYILKAREQGVQAGQERIEQLRYEVLLMRRGWR